MGYEEIKKYLPDYISEKYLFSILPDLKYTKAIYDKKMKIEKYFNSLPDISKDDWDTVNIK